jgi:O-antigen ligase
MLVHSQLVTREAKQMYFGGGIVGTVLIVLIVLFLVGRV